MWHGRWLIWVFAQRIQALKKILGNCELRAVPGGHQLLPFQWTGWKAGWTHVSPARFTQGRLRCWRLVPMAFLPFHCQNQLHLAQTESGVYLGSPSLFTIITPTTPEQTGKGTKGEEHVFTACFLSTSSLILIFLRSSQDLSCKFWEGQGIETWTWEQMTWSSLLILWVKELNPGRH